MFVTLQNIDVHFRARDMKSSIFIDDVTHFRPHLKRLLTTLLNLLG